MSAKKDSPEREPYATPDVVRLGSVVELTKLNLNGGICDGTPCTGNWRLLKASEQGKKPEEIPMDHTHDPKQPKTPPQGKRP